MTAHAMPDAKGLPQLLAPQFARSRIETAFREFYSQKHAALDPLGFAFTLAWCVAAAFRLECALPAVQQAALALLAAAAAAAASMQQLDADQCWLVST